jgi:hypothetical protein
MSIVVGSGSITINKDLFKVQKIWALNGEWKFKLLKKEKERQNSHH